jgi:type I restriction enzyme M protein
LPKKAAKTAIAKLEKLQEKLIAKLAERDEQIAEASRRAVEDRQDVAKVSDDLVSLYSDPDELLKHARVVPFDEIEENEFNLNITRYVDTYEPEPRVGLDEALNALAEASRGASNAEALLKKSLRIIGYGK